MAKAKEKTSLQLLLRSLSTIVGSIGMTYSYQHEDTWGGMDKDKGLLGEVSTHVNTLPCPHILRIKTLQCKNA